jgi:predicted Zn-dependent peptidase
MNRHLRALAANPALPIILVFCAALLAAVPASAVRFADLESQVQKYTLPNGLTFLVLERHDAPVFSFRTYVDGGGVNEVVGTTGIAHMFEHMAFKGTETVGTTDYAAEKTALDAVDAAWDALAAEQRRGFEADSSRLRDLDAAFKKATEDARKYVVSNDYSKVLEENGAADLNAFTEMDATQYLYSLPSNRIGLWARMEGDRLTHPVLREFYTERSVVQEERRFQESSPAGRLFSTWWLSSFLAHPYGNGLIGHPSDLKQITRRDAQAFFDKYYVASNITVVVVGDVNFAEIKKLADAYFSGVRPGAKPQPVRTAEPPHQAEIRVTIEEEAQPIVIAGYHIPGRFDPDYPAYELLGSMIGQGRSSRLYERLVKKDKIAAQTGGGTGFPGEKYPNLLILQAIVAKDVTTDQVEKVLYEELDRMAKDGPTAEELKKVKTRAKASFIRSLRSNGGLAGELAQYEGMQGDWHKLFRHLDRVDAVTTADIQRVAKETLRQGNRCVGVCKKPVS